MASTPLDLTSHPERSRGVLVLLARLRIIILYVKIYNRKKYTRNHQQIFITVVFNNILEIMALFLMFLEAGLKFFLLLLQVDKIF
jgi:hypothetical protein